MSQIVISDNMESEVVEEIRQLGEVVYLPENLADAVNNADVLIVRSKTKVTKSIIEGAPRLKIIARAGVGLDNIDLKTAEEKGIVVINTPGASANAVAELTIGHIFSMLRNIAKAHHQMKSKIWDKKHLVGRELEGKTLGIIGYGRIGSMVGKKANALGMKIIAYNPPPRHEDGIAEFIDDFDAFLSKADVITLHVPLTETTKNMINEETIGKMKDGVYVLNTSRGGIVDEDALYGACESGKVAAAALDVYAEEPYTGKLLELDNVFFTPHIGASTKESQLRIGKELVEKIKKELA
jgi:D-3-phosphoglycerate dehydrogenase